MPKRLRTRISQAYWCGPETCAFEPANISSVNRNGDYATCWVDELFEGGILLPDLPEGTQQAVTMVLSGPPGTGKTTFAMELCCRSAQEPKKGEQQPDELPRPLSSLYVTSESHKQWMIDNAYSFKWDSDDEGEPSKVLGDTDRHAVRVVTLQDVAREAGAVTDDALDLPRGGSVFKSLFNLLKGGGEPHAAPVLHLNQKPALPSANRHIIVIDSLNTIEMPKSEAYRHFMQLATQGPRLIVAIADSGPMGDLAREWEFAADIVVRLDRRSHSGYLLRSIEVVKARYQEHVWGKHQLKIYPKSQLRDLPPGGPPKPEAKEEFDAYKALRIKRLRAHPYRKEGGIFVFPSIHYVLSRYKTLSPTDTDGWQSSPVPYLNHLLHGGFPKGRCIALIGGRGTHKSHLGYIQVLSGLVAQAEKPDKERSERAIVVSLRDGEDMTRDTMRGILKDCFHQKEDLLDRFERDGRLEITYFPPGFITPEEFFHRMMLSIHRMKAGSATHITVLFNSLDQLSSRFPLCAKQSIFVPGIIQMLSAEGVTSYFVAAHDRSSKADYYGLDSMAELIVQLNRKVYPRAEYLGYVRRAFPNGDPETLRASRWPKELGAVELRVERFAGGQPAGAAGILELVDNGPLCKIYPSRGLVLAPYAPEHLDETFMAASGTDAHRRRGAAMRKRVGA